MARPPISKPSAGNFVSNSFGVIRSRRASSVTFMGRLILNGFDGLVNVMNGFLLIDKPGGITSHDVVDAVRRVAGIRAVGHAGTLDPFATGLLILGLGPATKKLGELIGLDKTYEATLTLGATSDTFDRDGVITVGAHPSVRPSADRSGQTHGSAPTESEIESVLDQFRGGYDQRAPIFSAKKIKGKKLYELARAGTATEEMRPIKHVTISELSILDAQYPILRLRIVCSSGTYIRSLADDIGRALGVGAYLSELRRTSIGTWSVNNAIPLKNLNKSDLDKILIK
ncbi:tRNA pseudouridine(55) synthase TruB [Candidatus Uhrbacteria bacterium]|nr:tRNA pseudouridine(55) synthase TruB [Candidatus Uhrbacteria bacterium]